MSRQRKIPTPAWEQHTGLPGGMSASRARQFAMVGIIGVVVVAIGIIAAGFLMDWLDERALPGSTAISVEDRKYSVEEMTERARLFSAETGNTQATLVLPTASDAAINEALLLKFASEKGVEATDEEIKAEYAKLLGITVDDPGFDNLLQQEIASLDMSEDQYRDYAKGRVLDSKMTTKFTEELPAAVESVHYRQIQVADQATADEIMRQLAEGADFAALAAEHSTDTTSKDAGGDKGWVPRGVLSEAQEDILFGLDPNENALYPSAGGQVFVYQAVERSDSQPIDESFKPTLASSAYSDWKTEKRESVTVVNNLDSAEGDTEKIRFVIENAGLMLSQ